MPLPPLEDLQLVAGAAFHAQPDDWWRPRVGIHEQVDGIIFRAELRRNMEPLFGPLRDFKEGLAARLARLANSCGVPVRTDTLVVKSAQPPAENVRFEEMFDKALIRVALNRLELFLEFADLSERMPEFHFDDDSHEADVISGAVFVVASVCQRSKIGFPTIHGLPPLECYPLHSIIESTTQFLQILYPQPEENMPLSAPAIGRMRVLRDQPGFAAPIHQPAPPWFPPKRGHNYPCPPAFAHDLGCHQQRPPPSLARRPGPASGASVSTQSAAWRRTASPKPAMAAPTALRGVQPDPLPLLSSAGVRTLDQQPIRSHDVSTSAPVLKRSTIKTTPLLPGTISKNSDLSPSEDTMASPTNPLSNGRLATSPMTTDSRSPSPAGKHTTPLLAMVSSPNDNGDDGWVNLRRSNVA